MGVATQCVAIGVDGCGRYGLEGTERYDPCDKTSNGANDGVARTAMANGLIADTVFLSSKRKSSERGGLEIRHGALEMIESTGADPEVEIAKPEQAIRGIVG